MTITLPISMDTQIVELDQTPIAPGYSIDEILRWGQDQQGAPPLLAHRRVILGADLGSLPAGTITSAILRLKGPTNVQGVGNTNTNWRRLLPVGITDAANWLSKNGGVTAADLWSVPGALADTTTVNQVTAPYNPAGIGVEVFISGFEGMMNDARNAGQPTLNVLTRATAEATTGCARFAESSDAPTVGDHPYYLIEMTIPPEVPTYISPTNGSTGNDKCGVILEWNAAAFATSYNVYFGTASNPPLIATGVTALFFVPNAPLLPSTTYFWKIGAVNADGETIGAIWSFTTTDALVAATTPSPANGATGVAIAGPTYSFTGDADATQHDFFIWADGQTEPVNPTIEDVNPAGFTHQVLQPSTLYHWKIRSTEGCTFVSVTWTFTTAAAGVGLPGVPTDPSPGAVLACQQNVSISTTSLTWTNGANTDIVIIDLQESPELLFQGIGGTVYDPAVQTHLIAVSGITLEFGHTYYWQVQATNGSGTTMGPVWCFVVEQEGGVDDPEHHDFSNRRYHRQYPHTEPERF